MRRREAGWPTGTCPDEAKAVLAGVRSPPLRWGEAEQGWPSGENPGITQRVVFSEGRTPCVLLAWPNVCRGIPFSRDGRAKPGDPWGHASIKRELSLRACGARTSPARPSEVRGLGGKIRNHAKGRFFGKGPVSASALGAE